MITPAVALDALPLRRRQRGAPGPSLDYGFVCGFRVETNRSSVRSSNAFVVRTFACRPRPPFRAVYPCLVLMQFPHVDPEDPRTTLVEVVENYGSA